MEYSIQEVARAAGTTSRTLRHYDSIGLVTPARIGANGYRFYDDRSLVRLQRVLLLRELGLGLDSIASVLAAQDTSGTAEADILTTHLDLLRTERARVDRQIGAVERTIQALRNAPAGEQHTHDQEKAHTLMNENIFDGFDHTQHREEVEARWGADAYATSDRWWRGLGKTGQEEWKAVVEQLNTDWVEAARSGVDEHSPTAQALAERHLAWLRSVPGAPAGENFDSYVRGLSEMYVADERFAANYGGVAGAEFVRAALLAQLELSS